MGTGESQRYCVYCASSRMVDPVYFEAADTLGKTIALGGGTIVYGGGGAGLMGCVADAALAHNGKVIGIIPRFMQELEWGHKDITELRLVNDLHERKSLMIKDTSAVIALPGGCGTLEELVEAITWKRLGLYLQPVVIVNVRGYYDPLIEMLNRTVDERFMGSEHRKMWTVIDNPEEVLDAIRRTPPWSPNAIDFAAVK